MFPIYITKGGPQFSFCPGKVTRDPEVISQFQELALICEFKTLPIAGGLNDQDANLIDDLKWFFPKYEVMKFTQKASMILGDPSSNVKAAVQTIKRR